VHQIKIHGLGGQGVVTGAEVFSQAVGLVEMKYAQTIPAYGHERRGAPVYADVVIDDQPIKLKSFVYSPDCVVLFDMSVISNHGVDVMRGTGPNTIFVVNAKDTREFDFGCHEVYYVNALQIALDTIKRDIPNSAMLGAMAAAGLAKIGSITNALRDAFGGLKGDLNAQAAQRAFENTQKYV